MNQKGMIQAGLAVAAAGAMGVFAMGRGAPAAKLASSLNMRGLVGSGKGAGAAFDGLAQFSGAAGGSSLAEGGLIGARALKASPAAPASVRKIVRAATLS
ncbi:MAG TPA: hypothetical protein VNI01_02240, partial [Elusimicrobiota bacterium]|nr:hypothetical protein [Elusimicrobiota bacterium]